MADVSKSAINATQDYADTAADLVVQNIVITSSLSALSAVGNAINTTAKFKNKLVEDENGRVYRSLGALAASVWRPFDDQSGFSDITPTS